MDILVHIFRSSGRVFFVKVLLSEVFKLSFCLSKTYLGPEYFVCQKIYCFVVGRFLYVQFVRFLQVLVLLFFMGLHVVSEGFFSGSLCLSEFWVSEGCFMSFDLMCQRFQGLNVRRLLGVLFFQFKVCVSNDSKI